MVPFQETTFLRHFYLSQLDFKWDVGISAIHKQTAKLIHYEMLRTEFPECVCVWERKYSHVHD